VVSRYGEPDFIVLVEPFVRLHTVENPLLEVVMHANLHWIAEVGLRKVTDIYGNRSKNVESSVNIARRECGIG
jgi:hypothetical protein